MKPTLKKFFAFSILALSVVVFSGCGFPQTTPTETATPTPTTTPSITETKPVVVDPATLPALPADNKKAIDSEVQNIDQTLKETDAALSKDVTDKELGL